FSLRESANILGKHGWRPPGILHLSQVPECKPEFGGDISHTTFRIHSTPKDQIRGRATCDEKPRLRQLVFTDIHLTFWFHIEPFPGEIDAQGWHSVNIQFPDLVPELRLRTVNMSYS